MTNLAEELISRKQEEFNRITDDIHECMFGEESNEITREFEKKLGLRAMYRTVFEDFFLPRILGEVKDPRWVGMWQSVAVTLAGHVDVYDDDTGEFLYRVPGILQTSKISPVSEEGTMPGSEVVSGYKLRSGNRMNRPDEYLATGLRSIYSSKLEGIDMSEELEQWKQILIRTGRAPADVESTNLDESTVETEDSDDGLSFDF